MNIHEYQAKELLSQYQVPVPRGYPAKTSAEAVAMAEKLGGNMWVVKAQIHAGGRGKAGGVKIAKSLADVKKLAETLLGKVLVTHQTGPQGKKVETLLIQECANITKEFYLGMVLDRKQGKIILMGSSEGGVEIEQVAHDTPEKIIKETIDPAVGLSPYIARKLAYGIGMSDELVKMAQPFFQGLYKLYLEKDCSVIEINPLIATDDGKLLALDAKMNFDDNALFRHPELKAYVDLNEESPIELEAKSVGLSYIALDGDIACMVNGAGLAMATMDIIKLFGGNPANFLDVGGGATAEAIEKAFTIILRDPKVKAIFVNIFGGIMRCDIIASGIIAAAKKLSIKIPLVVRLEGTNVELGKKMLEESKLPITFGNGFSEAAEKVVALAKSAKG